MEKQVDILLATYQGGTYLQEQLRSLMQQSYPHFHVWIRDDGSTDQTLSIIEAFQRRYPEHIFLIPSTKRLGIKGNFSALMEHAKAPYIMFCDQDDVWLPHKVERSLLCIKALENQCGAQTPLLVHTDLQVVKADLTIIDSSFWHYANLQPSLKSLRCLLAQNVVTGCTTLINQALLQVAYPIPSHCLMHDWWLALVASLFGKIGEIEEALILYRQHGKNSLGAKKFNAWQWIKQQIKKRVQIVTASHYQQAQCLLTRYSHLLQPFQKEILQNYRFGKITAITYYS